jgi:DNA segregation ATPase FtsK/SpoIIIE, S-DNA-T family
VGIPLLLATQKPTVEVITGLIKSNLPARIAFQVASRTDSRVVLDEMGADKLLGNGDMLFLLPGTSTLLRGQGTYLSDDEITRVVDYVGTDDPQFAGELMQLKTKEELEALGAGGLKNRDELYEAAVDIVVRERRGSVSLLQRALGIGYGRAARLIDFMAEDGIVGQYNGSQAREVLVSLEDWEAMSRSAAAGETAAASGGSGVPAPAGAGMFSATATSTRTSAGGPATQAATLTAPPRTRRNRIVPDPDEPSELEDDDDAPFDEAQDAEDEWEDSELEEEELDEDGDEYESDDEEEEWEYEEEEESSDADGEDWDESDEEQWDESDEEEEEE